jgi:hypothetical protein
MCPDCVKFLNTYKKTASLTLSLRTSELPVQGAPTLHFCGEDRGVVFLFGNPSGAALSVVDGVNDATVFVRRRPNSRHLLLENDCKAERKEHVYE